MSERARKLSSFLSLPLVPHFPDNEQETIFCPVIFFTFTKLPWEKKIEIFHLEIVVLFEIVVVKYQKMYRINHQSLLFFSFLLSIYRKVYDSFWKKKSENFDIIG